VFRGICHKHADLKEMWDEIEKSVYCEEDPVARVGFPDQKGQSSYYSANITSEDSKFVDEFCQSKNISPLNTRLFKDDKGNFELKICSFQKLDSMDYLKEHDFKDRKITVTAMDFSEFMKDVVASMEEAVKYAANEHQQKMVTDYIEHFRYGDVEKHKDSQRHWIKDVGPIVETNIGFIETYLDPSGARAEFEGFVSIVDKEISAKFNELVVQADDLIKKLPWDSVYEKDKFLKPDFTNLDIIAFACSGTPIGINIPNYDDIRQTEGFKNVNLGNVYPRPNKANIKFISEADKDCMVKYGNDSLTLIVALHELLGHGTGKLFTKDVNTGELNYDKNI
jgi:dipeptidyl-peptidase-3